MTNALEACLIRHLNSQLREFAYTLIDNATIADISFGAGQYGNISLHSTLDSLCDDYDWTWREREDGTIIIHLGQRVAELIATAEPPPEN